LLGLLFSGTVYWAVVRKLVIHPKECTALKMEILQRLSV
jgi:hypothetical protein